MKLLEETCEMCHLTAQARPKMMLRSARAAGVARPDDAARAEAMAATAVMQPAAVSFLSSSTGLLAMLDEEDNQLKAHALANINAVVPDFWAESEFCTGTAGARAHLARR
jgi:hypothetical protein